MSMLLVALLIAIQLPGRDASTFVRRVAELNLASAQRDKAATPDARATTTLAWLRALKAVLEAIPIERADGPHQAWLKANDELIVYSEPSGEWLIAYNLLEDLHAEHAGSAAADEIAWLTVTNRLPGECEGYVPCYAAGLEILEGGYLRAHPRGAHRREAIASIVETLRGTLESLARPNHPESFTVPDDCADLLRSMHPLRAAVAAAGGTDTEAVRLADRMIALCPQ